MSEQYSLKLCILLFVTRLQEVRLTDVQFMFVRNSKYCHIAKVFLINQWNDYVFLFIVWLRQHNYFCRYIIRYKFTSCFGHHQILTQFTFIFSSSTVLPGIGQCFRNAFSANIIHFIFFECWVSETNNGQDHNFKGVWEQSADENIWTQDVRENCVTRNCLTYTLLLIWLEWLSQGRWAGKSM
jgi:hypothetical protein